MNQAKKNTHDAIAQRLAELVKEGERLCRYANPFEKDCLSDTAKWLTSCSTYLEHVFGQESDYSKNFQDPRVHILYKLGALRAADEDFKDGHIFDLKSELFVEVSKDLLEQAEHFLGATDTDMGRALAAFLASCALETNLKELCQRHQVNISGTPSIGKMLDLLKEPLGLNALEIRKLNVCKGIRDSIAHGDWEKISSEDARRMIEDVSNFLIKYMK